LDCATTQANLLGGIRITKRWRDSGLMMTLHGNNAVRDVERHIAGSCCTNAGQRKNLVVVV
jgi:hypothetical protein